MSIFPRPLKKVLDKIIPFSQEDKIPTFNLGSGTADNTTYLRGDGTWVSPSSSGYVPYVGATSDVDLGTYKISADAVEFSLTPVNAAAAGQIVYDGASGALSYLLNNSNVLSRIGQTMHAYVHNAEAVTITKGQAVYLYQASGNKASVKLAYNTSDATSAKTFGLAAEDIGAGQNGMVICQGVLDGLNTGMYTAGNTLYLGATAGSYTATKPYAPNHLVYIGIVERANAGNGQIYVKTQNGYELDEIHDVDLITTPPVLGNVLTYNGSLWIPQAPSGGGGITIGTTAITSGTVGRILFEGTGNVVQEDSALFWDNTNKRLGVGTTPDTSTRLDVRAQGALSTDIAFRVRNSADTSNILTINGDGTQNWFSPANNALSTIKSNTYNLIQWGNENFGNIAIGYNTSNMIVPTTAYNTVLGANSSSGSSSSFAIGIGWNCVVNSTAGIVIGRTKVNGNYAIRIGYDGGASQYGGTNSIHLGRTVSGNDIAADNVFMTYFNSQSSSTLTRANGSFGLLGQQAYILANGTGIYGTDTFMGNGGNTLVIRNHASVPSTNVTDSFQLYSSDRGGTAGKASAHFRTEDGTINVLGDLSGIGTSTPGARLDVRAQGALSTDISFRVRNSADTFNIISANGRGDVFVGLSAGRVTTGVNNTFVGIQAGFSNTTGQENTAIGANAGLSNLGSQNTYLGNGAGQNGTTASGSIFIGYQAGVSSNALNGIFIGTSASTTGGSGTVAIGNTAGAGTGSHNISLGQSSGFGMTTGSFNMHLGYRSVGSGVTTGNYNTLVGSDIVVGNVSNNAVLADMQGNQAIRKDANHNVILGREIALATNATNGFTYIPTCAGIPTGVPTTVTGKAPIVADSTNNKLYIYLGGAWQALN